MNRLVRLLLTLLPVLALLALSQERLKKSAKRREDDLLGGDIVSALARAAAQIPTIHEGHASLWRIAPSAPEFVTVGATRYAVHTGAAAPALLQVVLEDGGVSNRSAAAASLLTTLGAGAAVAVVVPSMSDIDARRTAHASTFAAADLFRVSLAPHASPLELTHALAAFMHWPTQWHAERCCIADHATWAAAQVLAAIDYVPGGAVLRARGSAPPSADAASFNAVARAQTPVSDKVTGHAYGSLYGELLSIVRARARSSGGDGRPVRLLEIGLGCGMGYGEGAGPLIWRAYFGPALELTVLEYGAKCALAWGARPDNALTTVYTGDQRDVELLNRIITERGPFDVVIDDGGHCQECQIAAVEAFPAALTPGGVLVIEDLFSTMHPVWGADAPPATLGVIADIADALVARGPQFDGATRSHVASRSGLRPGADVIASMLSRLVCEAEICALVRAL